MLRRERAAKAVVGAEPARGRVLVVQDVVHPLVDLRLQIDVWEWVRRINAHAPAGGWLHSLAYVVLVGLTVAAWRVVSACSTFWSTSIYSATAMVSSASSRRTSTARFPFDLLLVADAGILVSGAAAGGLISGSLRSLRTTDVVVNVVASSTSFSLHFLLLPKKFFACSATTDETFFANSTESGAFLMSNDAVAAGRWADAAEAYTAALRAGPSTYWVVDGPAAAVLSNRSLAHLKCGLFEKALADAAECIALRPDWSKAHFRRGDVYRHMGDWRQAEACFSIACR